MNDILAFGIILVAQVLAVALLVSVICRGVTRVTSTIRWDESSSDKEDEDEDEDPADFWKRGDNGKGHPA